VRFRLPEHVIMRQRVAAGRTFGLSWKSTSGRPAALGELDSVLVPGVLGSRVAPREQSLHHIVATRPATAQPSWKQPAMDDDLARPRTANMSEDASPQESNILLL